MKMLYTLLLLLLALSSCSLGAEVTLSSANDFTDFVNSVNSGNNYSETTVYLGSDVTLSERIEPIGINKTYQFLGVFDGQGYVISNLMINSTSTDTGLFGFSYGMTTRNVVLDSSCAITSSFSGSNSVCLGGIIGACETYNDQCNIENIVNMAGVTFSGSISKSYNLFFGGIIGVLYSPSYSAYAKNCVNYGSVTDSGTGSGSNNYAEIGGIVGISDGGSLSSYKYIQNCLNYGAIIHNGESSNLIVGGIVGNCAYYVYIENCLSAGKIVMQTTASSESYIGSIVGKANSNTHINYCYYTSDVGASSLNGTGTPSSTTGTLTSPTDVDSGLVSKLNSNATSCNWSKWLLNANNATVTFKMGDSKELSFSSQIILIPDPVKERNSFLFWCKDADCAEEFEAESVSENTVLYAAWVNNTMTFDFDNGTTVNETFAYNTEIVYPDVKKEGYIFSQWSNYHEFMPAKDITVTAQWIPNNYTVTFDADGGNVSETSKIVTFNVKYGNLPEPTRTGYMFIGWFTNETNGTEVTNETIVTVPYNHTLYAHWEEVTTQVEIVFGTKDLTEEEIKELLKQYTTNTGFDIVKVEGEPGETRVIIKFTDTQSAEEFVRNIRESSDLSANNIKRIGFTSEDDNSFSSMLSPALLFNALLL